MTRELVLADHDKMREFARNAVLFDHGAASPWSRYLTAKDQGKMFNHQRPYDRVANTYLAVVRALFDDQTIKKLSDVEGRSVNSREVASRMTALMKRPQIPNQLREFLGCQFRVGAHPNKLALGILSRLGLTREQRKIRVDHKQVRTYRFSATVVLDHAQAEQQRSDEIVCLIEQGVSPGTVDRVLLENVELQRHAAYFALVRQSRAELCGF